MEGLKKAEKLKRVTCRDAGVVVKKSAIRNAKSTGFWLRKCLSLTFMGFL